MGETRHVHARTATVLAMMAAALMTVVAGSPARAAGGFPTQCVEDTYSQVTFDDDAALGSHDHVSVGSAAEPLCGAGTSRVVRIRR